MARLRAWWPGAPPLAGAIALTCALALTYGTVVHVVQWASAGWVAYPSLPAWLSAYFTLLTLADPLAAVLLWRRRRAGVVLGCVVLVTDAAANAYANYVLGDDSGVTPGRVGQALITGLALALVASTPWLWRASR